MSTKKHTLTPEEYEKRRQFGEAMKTMTQSEFIQIARILRSNGVTLSENRNGLFFNLATIPAKAFQDLVQFREFVEKSTTELAKRDIVIQGLRDSVVVSEE